MKPIIDWFDRINTEDIKPSELFKQIASELKVNEASPVFKAGFAIAEVADKDSKEKASYHNYTHTAEAMAAMFEMSKIEFKNASIDTIADAGVRDKNELVLLAVAAMAGHDIHHDGKDKALENPSTGLEYISAGAAKSIADTYVNDQNAADLIKYAIEATIVEESVSSRNIEHYTKDSKNPVYAIAQMATEADLAASISSKYGVAKGLMLSEEVGKAGNEGMAKGLASFNGRKFFLENLCKIHSKGGLEIGLEAERAAQVISMNVAQESLSSTLGDLRLNRKSLTNQTVSDLLGEDPCHEHIVKKLNDAITTETRRLESELGTKKLLDTAHNLYISTYQPNKSKSDLDFSL